MECPLGRFLSVLFRTRRKKVILHVAHTLKRICRLRFSFFANDQPIPLASARMSRDLRVPGSAGCRLGVVHGLVAQLVRARA